MFYYIKKKEIPQKAAIQEMMRGYLKDNDIRIKDGADVNAVMRDMMSVENLFRYQCCISVL